MMWEVPKMWEGGDVWILGGGPSVPKQFNIPNDVIQKVMSGILSPNVYSSYMESLHNKHVIGINVSYLIGNWIDMIFFGDNNFFLQHQKGLAEFPGLKVSCSPIVTKYNWVKYLERDAKVPRGITTNPQMISWNGNSGAAAISIAAHAGAKRIILLGFDMKLGPDQRQHWHDIYHRGQINTSEKTKKLPFDKHRRGFQFIAKDAKRLGIEIINASPDSAITEFPKVSVKDLL